LKTGHTHEYVEFVRTNGEGHTLEKHYEVPEVEDQGTLLDLTAAGSLLGSEDAGPKFSPLDVS
jgi:hypothetical protein